MTPGDCTGLERRTIQTVRRRLLAWFDRHQRLLPWRRDRDPYRIWVSEVMLQQTQVATVIPYFERFLAAFPDVHRLAAADEQEVLRLWEGLGYYRRARDLHRAARQLVAQGAGPCSDDPALWASLPGVGRYILGAVLSQAFDRRLPIVEANSLRVLCRLFAFRGDPRKGPGQRWLWQTAEKLLPRRRVGDFNQALMELGALICFSDEPDCGRCPLQRVCVAHRLGRQDEIPSRPPAQPVVAVAEVAVIVFRRRRVLLAQRPGDGRWGNMWEFPHGPVRPDESADDAAARLLQDSQIRASISGELATLRHAITRYQVTLTCLEATFQGGTFRSPFYPKGRWIAPAELQAFPVSAPQRRLARLLVAETRQRSLF